MVVVFPFVPVTPRIGIRQVVRCELDLAPDRDRAQPRDDRGSSRGTPGLLTSTSAPSRSETSLVVAELAVDAHDLDAVPLEQRSRGLPRAGHAEDDRALHRRTTRLSSAAEPAPSTLSTDRSGTGITSPSPIRNETRGSG